MIFFIWILNLGISIWNANQTDKLGVRHSPLYGVEYRRSIFVSWMETNRRVRSEELSN